MTSLRAPRVHRAWGVAGVALLASVGASGFRATPGALSLCLAAALLV